MDENPYKAPRDYKPICRVGIALGSLWLLGLAHVFLFIALGLYHPPDDDNADEIQAKIFYWWFAAQTIIATSVVAASLRCLRNPRHQ